MKNELRISTIIISIIFLIVKTQANNIIVLNEGIRNKKTITLENEQVYKIAGDKSIIHVVEYSNPINCTFKWYIQAGSIPSDNNKYIVELLSNKGTKSMPLKMIKCDWFFKIKLQNSNPSKCTFKIRYVNSPNSNPTDCCQTQCKASTATNNFSFKWILIFIFVSNFLINLYFL